MRLINELNKIGKQLLGDNKQDGYFVPGAPPPPVYAQSHQHAMSCPPPLAPSLPYPAGPSPTHPPFLPPSAPSPMSSSPTPPHHQSTWPPPNGPAHGAPQPPPFNPVVQFPVSSAPTYSTGYSAAPQTYTTTPPPQAFQPPPSFTSYPSPPHSFPPQSFTSPQATHYPPFGSHPISGLSPTTSSAAQPPHAPHTPHFPSHNHSHSLSIPSPPGPATEPSHDPTDWVAALHDLLPPCLNAARDHVASAHMQPDTIWLYFVDLGAGQYFADAVYGIDGNAFAKDDLVWAGVPPNPERSTALYRILAGEWVTKICLRSKVEEVHPSRVVVTMDVASGGFGSTMCYEVASVRHPRLSPAQVLTLWVARLKATGDDSADFMPA